MEMENFLRLDGCENPFGSPLTKNYHLRNHGLDKKIKEQISVIKGVPVANVFLGNSNESFVSALMMAFCEPNQDNVLVCPPTADYFSQIADIQSVGINKAMLVSNYQLDIESVAGSIDDFTKIIFLCSPNTPTGNSMAHDDVEIILNNFDGLVVVDETFIHYARQRSFSYDIKNYPNLVVLQNFDVAWAGAGLNIAMAFGSEKVIDILNATMPKHGVSQASLEVLDEMIGQIDQINQWTKDTVMLKNYLIEKLSKLPIIQKIYPSETNFLLVRFNSNVEKIHSYLIENQIFVENCHHIILCENCLKIRVGTLKENERLIKVVEKLSLASHI
jgi:histidinol-phosphate aminotransferase